MGDENKRPFAELSVDSQLLIRRLTEAAEGEVVTYGDLSKIIGRAVQNGGGRGCLQTARRRMLNDYGRHFMCIKGVGIKWDPIAVVGEGTRSIDHIRRSARTGRKKLATAAYERLDKDTKVTHNQAMIALGIYELFGRSSRQKKLNAAVSKAQNHLLPDAEAIKAMFGNGEAKD